MVRKPPAITSVSRMYRLRRRPMPAVSITCRYPSTTRFAPTAGRARGGGRWPASPRGRVACAAGNPAGSGRVRARPRSCRVPPIAAARLSTPTGPPPNLSITAASSLRSIRSRPAPSTSSIDRAASAIAELTLPEPFDLRVIADAPQQAVGDARRTTRAAGDFERTFGSVRHSAIAPNA